MPRLPRFFVDGQPQHVIQRGNNRAEVFAQDADRRHYLDLLAAAAAAHGAAVHAYVLMTNHIHLLVTPETEHSLPRTLKAVAGPYAQYFNIRYARTGTLWDGRYRATLIDSERYLLACMRYIELNPVRAGMVADPAAYPWSSYRANGAGRPDPLVRPHGLYLGLGEDDAGRRAAYRALFRDRVELAELEAIRAATNKAWALGDDGFRRRMAALGGRRASPARRGPRHRNRSGSDPN